MDDLIDAMQRNWSVLEVVWSLMAVLGIVLSSRALSRATVLTLASLRDEEGSETHRSLLERVREIEWPTRRRLIKRIRDAAGAYFRHIGFLVIGITALAAPAPPPNPDVDVTPGLAAALVFVSVIVWDIISLQWDERDWITIVKALVRDPLLWQRIIQDEERIQAKQAEQLGEVLPRQAHTSETDRGRCSHHGDEAGSGDDQYPGDCPD